MVSEKWADGRTYLVERDSRGRFVKRPILRTITPTFFIDEEEEPEPEYWRATVGCNFVERGHIYSTTLQEFYYSWEVANSDLDNLEDQLLKKIEDRLGYKRGEWWFVARVGRSVQRVYEEGQPYFKVQKGPAT